MSVYNESNYLNKAIDSILAQTYKEFEFIIVDDCSQDGSFEIVQGYAKKDNRIKVIKNKINLGLAVSLNKAVEESKGKYIARMDADDISLPSRLQKQIEYMEKNTAIHICGTGLVYIDKNGQELKKLLMAPTHKQIQKEICKRSPFAHPSVMIRRSFFDMVGLYDQKLRKAQDYELWARGLVKGAKYANLGEHLLFYRYEPVKTVKTDLYGVLVKYKVFIMTKNFKCLLYAVGIFGEQILKRIMNYDQTKK